MTTDDLRTRAREAAAEAHPEPWPGMVPMAQFSYAEGYAAGYLAHAAQQPTLDVDELARVLHDAACACDGTAHTPQWWENRERSARAVVAHLTKGDENDE